VSTKTNLTKATKGRVATLKQAKSINKQMTAHEAMRKWHAQHGERDKANAHAEKMLEYRRLLGAWYTGIEREAGKRTKPGNSAVTRLQDAMAELGHTKMTRRRLEAEASVPDEIYNAWVAETLDKPESLLTAAALRKLARGPKQYEPPAIDFDPPQVWCMSWDEWLPTQPPCDLLLTDPPYMTDVKDVGEFAYDWLPVALDHVKSTGRAYVCVGSYPDELYAYLSIAPPSHLVMDQVLVWTYRNTLGQNPKLSYKLNWQAILYYRGKDAPPLNVPKTSDQFSVFDINAPDGRLGDRCHAWQKPDKLAQILVEHSTKPGDLVLDPFCCTGTFILAANRSGRIGRGCDISKANLGIAKKRGCQREA
jgi:hypothetical protein